MKANKYISKKGHVQIVQKIMDSRVAKIGKPQFRFKTNFFLNQVQGRVFTLRGVRAINSPHKTTPSSFKKKISGSQKITQKFLFITLHEKSRRPPKIFPDI